MFATRSDNQTVFESYADGVNLGIATHLMGHEQHDAAFIGGIQTGTTSLEAILDELNKKLVQETKAGINNGEYNNYSTLSAAYLSANGDLTIGWAGDSPIKLEIRNPKTGEIRNMNIEFEGHTNGQALVKFCDPGIVTDFEFKHSNIQTYLDYGSQIWGIDASEVQFSVNAESDGITEDHLPLLFKDRAVRGKDFILDKYAPINPKTNPPVPDWNKILYDPTFYNFLTTTSIQNYGSDKFVSAPSHYWGATILNAKKDGDNITSASTSFMTLAQLQDSKTDLLVMTCDGVSTPIDRNAKTRGKELSEYIVNKIGEIILPHRAAPKQQIMGKIEVTPEIEAGEQKTLDAAYEYAEQHFGQSPQPVSAQPCY